MEKRRASGGDAKDAPKRKLEEGNYCNADKPYQFVLLSV
jgi:hypothetical protein